MLSEGQGLNDKQHQILHGRFLKVAMSADICYYSLSILTLAR